MAKKPSGKKIRKRSAKTLHKVQSRLVKERKARLLSDLESASEAKFTLKTEEIQVAALARPIRGLRGAAPPSLGIIVYDGNTDSDLVISADLDDSSDGIEYEDKDLRDQPEVVDKDARDWAF